MATKPNPATDAPHHVFQNFIFMGDFNAGCNYVPKKAWSSIRLRTDPEFIWLIGDQEDTTVKTTTNCAYDRWEPAAAPAGPDGASYALGEAPPLVRGGIWLGEQSPISGLSA